MEVANITDILPKELLGMILFLLPPRDLKAALLVCRSWKEVAERSKLWTWVCLRVTEKNLSMMPQVLSIERLKSIEKISLDAVSEELLLAIERHPGLKVLNARHCKLSSIEPSLLARVSAKLEEVDFRFAELTTKQYEAICRFPSCDSKLKKLDMSCSDLSSLDPETLAKFVSELEVVKLSDTQLNIKQCREIFRYVASDSKLKKLDISRADFMLVDPETLAMVIANLEDVNLSYTEIFLIPLQWGHWEAFESKIFRLAAIELDAIDFKLKKLDISHTPNLTCMNPETLACLVAKPEDVNLSYSKLLNHQWEAIFSKIASDFNLKKLDISYSDLSLVNPKTLARAVIMVEEVNLQYTKLTPLQCRKIFKYIARDSYHLKLKMLDIYGNDMSEVQPETLDKAVAKLLLLFK